MIENVISNAKQIQQWPASLGKEAYYGLFGKIVKRVEPHTESDPAAIMFSIAGLFGNCIGRSAHFTVEADRHFMNLFIAIVGDTAKARKGVSLGVAKMLFQFDKEWVISKFVNGLSSGEGLVWAVRNECQDTEVDDTDDNLPTDSSTVIDNRLMVIEPEFASTLKVLSREGNILSPLIRKAWDDGNLQILTKNNPVRSTNAHISVIAHITQHELLKSLNDCEYANGFGNRFLWVCTKRSKCLPEGGDLLNQDLTLEIKQLEEAVKFSSSAGEIKRDEQARDKWCSIYPELSAGKDGFSGSMLARSEAQVMRLACIYALTDCKRIISIDHLNAALALWSYCEASTNYIFGSNLGDTEADIIYQALERAGKNGLTKTAISDLYSRHKSKAAIAFALNTLKGKKLAASKTKETNGRHLELWYTFENYQKINNPYREIM